MSDTLNSLLEVQPPENKRRLSRSEARAAREIAAQLNETEKRPIARIRLIIFRMGVEFAQTLLQEALNMEAQGGLMLVDGSRRRTLGGVFFYLVSQRLSPDMRKEIFRHFVHRRRKPAKTLLPQADTSP